MSLRALLPLLLLALLPLALVACADGEDDAEVVIPEEPSDIDNPALLGYWAVIEMNGEIPAEDQNIRYQFTPEGEFIRYEGDTVTRTTFTYASENQLTINDVGGTTFYDYAIDGDELTLTEPGENGDSITLTRLADVDLDEVQPAPEPSTSIPEDSVPTDGSADTTSAP